MLLPNSGQWEAYGKQQGARSSAVEQPTFNRQGVGSTPTAHTICYDQPDAGLAQLVEQPLFGGGSSLICVRGVSAAWFVRKGCSLGRLWALSSECAG